MRRNIAAALVAVIMIALGACGDDGGCPTTAPNCGPPEPPITQASLMVQYTSSVSGSSTVSVGFSSESFARNNLVMTETGSNTWSWEGDAEFLDQLQQDGDVKVVVTDGNLPSGQRWPGFPIRVSTVRDGEVLSSQETNAGNVWSDNPNPVTVVYYGEFRLMNDDTVMLIPGPGIPSSQ